MPEVEITRQRSRGQLRAALILVMCWLGATVAETNGELDSIEMDPENVNVQAGAVQKFTVTAKDAQGPVSSSILSWCRSVTAGDRSCRLPRVRAIA